MDIAATTHSTLLATEKVTSGSAASPIPSNTSCPSATATAPPTNTLRPTETATLTPAPTETPLPVPRFEPSRCLFDYPASAYAVTCGHLIVPQDRGQPDSSLIKLHVAVFSSKSPAPHPDPVIYLAGGSGANILDSATYLLRQIGDDILESRDFVMYNQRGTRYGEPWLDCPGYTEFLTSLNGRNLDREHKDALTIEFLLSCRDDLIEQGVDLAAYNTAANAADLNDLRIALGYDRVNLYGTSYGTKLALTVMRDYPEAVRSALVDSVFPPQANYYGSIAQNAHRAFSTFFKECAADPYCSQVYPDLEETFYRIVDELNANPVPLTSRQGIIFVDGGDFVNMLYSALYRASDLELLPLLIYRAGTGRLDGLKELFLVSDQSHISWGVHYSVLCHDDVAFETYEEAITSSADLPIQIADFFVSPFIFELCESWPAGQAQPIDNEPVFSDIPTLLLAGRYDPATPPAWAKLAAQTLSNSFYLEFPSRGHGVLYSDPCALEIGLAFLDSPTAAPDATCLFGLSIAGTE
jgi:pimeloyl-ACP methyl ester carboxylesterase